MNKIAQTLALSGALLIGACGHSHASTFITPWPWGWLGLVGINELATQGILAACHGRPDLSPTGLFWGAVPVVGPVVALGSCKQPARR